MLAYLINDHARHRHPERTDLPVDVHLFRPVKTDTVLRRDVRRGKIPSQYLFFRRHRRLGFRCKGNRGYLAFAGHRCSSLLKQSRRSYFTCFSSSPGAERALLKPNSPTTRQGPAHPRAPAARRPSPRPPACGWGCARGGGRWGQERRRPTASPLCPRAACTPVAWLRRAILPDGRSRRDWVATTRFAQPDAGGPSGAAAPRSVAATGGGRMGVRAGRRTAGIQ